jgi:Holliday junction resolvase
MNPNKNRGAKAERELAALLTEHLGIKVDRRRNLGTHEDIGDLLIPDTTIQVTACRDSAAELTTRARRKLADVDTQRQTQGARHAAVAIRIDGAGWRMIVGGVDADRLGLWSFRYAPDAVTFGAAIRWAPMFCPAWWTVRDGMWIGTVELWCEAWLKAREQAA